MIPYSPWLVWIVPTFSSLLVPLVSKFSGKARNCFAVLIGLVTMVFAFSMVPDIYFDNVQFADSTATWIPTFNIQSGVLVDPLTVLFVCLIGFFGVVIMIYSIGYMEGEEGLDRYYFFILLFIGAMNGLVISDNFIQMFVFWEVVGLCSYSLVSFWYKRPEAVQAGMKVFLMTRVGDVCLLAAIGLLYMSLGSFSFSYTVANISSVPMPTLTAIAFLILAAAVAKSAQLPLHTWLQSAMEAPTSVSALLHGATMVKAGVYLIARTIVLFGPIAATIPMWLPSLAWIGVITAFVGATLALHTPDIKGVQAYSTISQIGFMMAALGTASSSSSSGWFAGLFHLMSHAFFQGLGFLTVGGIVHALGTRDMRLMGGLRKAMPLTFGLSIVVMLARTGVPPFSGFFSKGLIINSLWSTGDLLLVITIWGSAAVTFAYTLRFIKLTFLGEKSDFAKKADLHEPSKTMLFPSVVLAVLCLVWGLAGNLVAHFMHVNAVFSVSEIFSASTVLFAVVLFIGGFPVYFVYYRKPSFMRAIRDGFLHPVDKLLEHGYFFDDVYRKIFVAGLVKLSHTVAYVENIPLSRLPILVANSFMDLANVVARVERVLFDSVPLVVAKAFVGMANGTRRYFDVFVEEILYLATNRTLASASRVSKMHSESLQRYIVMTLVGFLILLVLIILTMLR